MKTISSYNGDSTPKKDSNSRDISRRLGFGFILYFIATLILIGGITEVSGSAEELFSQQSNGTVYFTSLSPANLTQTLNTAPDFTFISYSDKNSTYSCTLYIDDTPYGTNSSVQNNTETTITANASLSSGDHIWYINCTDSEGTYKSKVRIIGIGANFSRCAILVDSGTYYLNESIINSSIPSCINISANNVTLDCQRYTIDGNDSAEYGIYIYRSSQQTTNITMKNCVITDWKLANVYLYQAHGNTIVNVISNSSFGKGLYLNSSSSNTLFNITANSNMDGIHIEFSSSNNLSNIFFFLLKDFS